ncbi:MAG: TonB-dependent receptor plug domain-containing protein, partial [Nitrospirae bacterium]|nr:TonB-dependent receptor plug domain-containing protein [Nitrospirota bacterium]
MSLKYFCTIILCLMFSLFPVILLAGDGDSESMQNGKDEMLLASKENEEQLLYAYYGNDATVITSTRYLKPVSQVAENMSVVTADMIKQMNAHTVAEALNVITGVQVDERLVFSNYSAAGIQGTGFGYVRILIDGVTLNNLTSNGYLLGNLPVQYIERIEIIKGPASSSWGSSLGGVINIVTKSGAPNNKISGMLSSSYGERGSGDYRGEAGGQVSKLNYYVSGTYLGSNGFTPYSALTNSTFYTKEKLDLTDKVNIVYTLGYTNIERGNGYYAILGNIYGNSGLHDLFTTLTLNASLTDQLSLSIGGRYINIYEDDIYYRKGRTSDTLYQDQLDDEHSKGATVTLTWRPEGHTITLGSDYDDGKATNLSVMGGDKTLTKTAFFVNDTVSLIKNVYITPGLRFDEISANGNFLSPSLGIAYNP